MMEVEMKKLIVLMLVLLSAATLSVFAQGVPEVAVKPVVLKMSEVHAEGYPTSLADHEFARLVNERTNGRIQIEVYTGGTLYAQETGAIEALQVGDLAFASFSISGSELCSCPECDPDAISLQQQRSYVGCPEWRTRAENAGRY